MRKVYVITAGKTAKLLFIGIGLVLLLAGLWGRSLTDDRVVAVSTGSTMVEQEDVISFIERIIPNEVFQQSLSDAWVGLSFADGESSSEGSFIKTVMKQLVGFDPTNPAQCLAAQMPALQAVEKQSVETIIAQAEPMDHGGEEDFYVDIPPELADWHFEMNEQPISQLGDEELVLLYNTHNAECYKSSSGASKQEGKNAGVSIVARTLEQTLEEQYQVKTFYSNVIHDYPEWSRSYIKSLETAQTLLKKYDKVQAVFDIHRDAGFTDKKHTTMKVNGQEVARITIVLGTNHERWKENYAFAQKIEKKANELYPGLIRDVRLRADRVYNQQVHPHSMILEVGSDLNTQQEANLSAKYFAEVLVKILQEENKN